MRSTSTTTSRPPGNLSGKCLFPFISSFFRHPPPSPWYLFSFLFFSCSFLFLGLALNLVPCPSTIFAPPGPAPVFFFLCHSLLFTHLWSSSVLVFHLSLISHCSTTSSPSLFPSSSRWIHKETIFPPPPSSSISNSPLPTSWRSSDCLFHST